jgi:hypothetical protein
MGWHDRHARYKTIFKIRSVSMKRLLVIVVCIFSLGFTPAAFADLSSDATSHVWVDVVANVAVGVIDAQVDIGDIQTGEFETTITFRVDANMEDVNLYPLVTHLYKGDDPSNSDVAPIPVDSAKGVMIQPTNANPTQGADNNAGVPVAANIGLFEGFQFEQINFESSQNGHFSQDVDVTAYWVQNDPEKPQGEYSGFVQLFCVLTP